MRGICLALLLTLAPLALAQTTPTAQPIEPGVSGAESRLLNRSVPDIPLRLSDGRSLPLSQLWQERPLLLTFFYRRCQGVCTPFLEWLRDAAQGVGGLGKDYRIVALSFDDADTARDIGLQADALGLAHSPDWILARADRSELERMTSALNFAYRYDAATRQYDHNALVVGIDQGRVVRAQWGGEDEPRRLRELLWQMRGKFISTYALPGQMPLSCFSFDPASGKTRLDWGMLLLLLPALMACVAATAVFIWRAPRAGPEYGRDQAGGVTAAV